MRSTETRNAKIGDTFLGREDHGLFIAQIGMDYGGSGQAFQRILDPETCYGVLNDIFRAVGVDSWEQLQGKSCRVVVRDGLIRQIGHYLQDIWTPEPE